MRKIMLLFIIILFSLPIVLASPICTDPDGRTILGTRVIQCIENSNELIVGYCVGNGYYAEKTHICPNGCSDGKCIERIDGCNLWFDGCNTCEVINGEVGACTKKACIEYEKPGCLEYIGEEQVAEECPLIGYRENGLYCNIGYQWEDQLEGGAYCDNNFECSSNSCLDSKCTDVGFWSKLFEWLGRIFG